MRAVHLPTPALQALREQVWCRLLDAPVAGTPPSLPDKWKGSACASCLGTSGCMEDVVGGCGQRTKGDGFPYLSLKWLFEQLLAI